jgi:hypothetical protein
MNMYNLLLLLFSGGLPLSPVLSWVKIIVAPVTNANIHFGSNYEEVLFLRSSRIVFG